MHSRQFPIVLVLFAFLITLAVSAIAGPEKVSPLLRSYTHPEATGLFDAARHQEVSGVFSAATEQGIRCLIQGDVTRAELEALGISVTTQAGPVFTATVPGNVINALSDLPGIVRIQPARYLKPTLNQALTETQIEPQVHGGSLPPYTGGNRGSGVVVGACDSGFDYSHDDFRSGGLSRFNSIWDQQVNGSPPSGYGYGTEWNKTSLDNLTSTTTDTDGHGTHVMGIMASNGSGTGNGQPAYQYVGVAPEATMIGVKTLFSDASIIDGVNYIFQQAGILGMPAVANLSLGGQYGPHDGTDPLDTALSALTGADKILVCSAGNERGEQLHARGQIPSGGSPSTVEFSFQLDAYSKIGGTQNDLVLFDGYYESTDNYQVTVIGPTGGTLGPISRGVFNSTTTTDGAIQIDNGTATNSGGDYEVFIALYDANSTYSPRAGTWTIRYTRVASTNSNIDLWNYYNASHMSGRFTTNWTDEVTIGSPGSALDAITVASYVTKSTWQSVDGNTYSYNPLPFIGTLSTFSSGGPLRDGTQKPDIAGPGQGLVSTLSDDVPVNAGTQPRIVPDGVHWVLEGTSMSSPMVAGLCALVLNRDPGMTPAQMKTRLNTYAKADAFTSTVPNFDWGYGKIRGESADMTAPSPTVLSPNGGEQITGGSVHNITWSATDNFVIDTVDLYYSTDGGATYPNVIATGEVHDGTYAWSVPASASTTVRVKAVVWDRIGNAGEDVSNADFEIVIPDVTDPTVAVTAPNGGESWQEGSVQDITWTASDTGTNKPGVHGVAATIAGVDSVSIFYSVNDGTDWILIASGEDNDGTYSWTLPSTPTDSARVKVQAWDPSMNMGEDQSDARFVIASATGIGDRPIPVALTLAQSRPNPLTRAGRAEIAFGLTQEGPVTLRVFDAAGRQVAVVADGSYPAGFHTVSWDGRLADGSRASSGMYFYRLETREGMQSKKLMVIR